MSYPGQMMDANGWKLERRSDGAVLVSVPSHQREGYGREAHGLPDAVFAFCFGDPQYSYWEQRLREQEISHR